VNTVKHTHTYTHTRVYLSIIMSSEGIQYICEKHTKLKSLLKTHIVVITQLQLDQLICTTGLMCTTYVYIQLDQLNHSDL